MSSGRCDRSVTELSEIQKGDHIRWDRGSYSHHAIVTDKNTESKKNLLVVYYTDPKRSARAEVVEEWVKAFTDDPLYVVDYRVPTYPFDEVIKRARSRLGEKKVRPLDNNCESFAISCKTPKKNIPFISTAVRIAEVVPVAGPVIGKVADRVADTTDRVNDAADRVVDMALYRVADATDKVFGGAVDEADKVVREVVGTADKVVGGVVDTAENVVGEVVGTAEKAVDEVVDTAEKVVGGVVDTAGTVANTAVDAVGETAKGIFGAIGSLF